MDNFVKPDYYEVLAQFSEYPKNHKGDVTLDFFEFLEKNYLDIWERLNLFYADDWTWYDPNDPNQNGTLYSYNPRQALHGWDDITKPGHFGEFLSGIKSDWTTLTGCNFAKCSSCGEEKELETEHRLIVSYNFGPVVKYYEEFEMDGSVHFESLVCRECAMKTYKALVDKVDIERETCWV